MTRLILTLLFALFLSTASAQKGKLYLGTINKTIKISLYLQGLENGTNADPIVGSYKYDNQNSYILLNGYRNNRGNIVLVEQESANFSGVFLGSVLGKKFSGKWLSDDRKKNYSFELVQTSATDAQAKKFDDAITAKADQFRKY